MSRRLSMWRSRGFPDRAVHCAVSSLCDDFKVLNVLIALSEFVELGLQVEVLVGELELADSFSDIGLDVRDTIDLGQIAAHGSGTATSVHFG